MTRAVEQYLTNFRTYISTTFAKKQTSFLYTWCQRHNKIKDLNTIRHLINGWVDGKSYNMSPKTVDMINFHRKLLRLKQGEYVCDRWVKNNYERIIVYYHVLSMYLIKHGQKGILTAPMNKIKMSFIHIDNRVFYSLLNKMSDDKISLSDFEEDKDIYWNSIFDTSKFLTKNQKQICNFSYCVQTDGVSLCIHYRRPKKDIIDKKDSYIPNKNSTDRIIGQDPGRCIIFSGSEQLENGTWKKYILTKRKFYQESGINDCNKDSRRWNKNVKSINDSLSLTNTRSTIGNFIKYTKIIKSNWKSLWKEYSDKKWAKNRLKLYSGKKRVYDKFFNSLKDKSGRKIIIAYGDAGFKSSSKHELSAPTTKVLSTAKKHFKVVMIDEFKTTQVHYETGIRLSKIINITDDVKKSVRGLLWCRSTIGSKFVSRDLNASKNMVKCYDAYPERPIGLRRDEPTQDAPKAKYRTTKTTEKLVNLTTSPCCGNNVLPFTHISKEMFQNILG